MQFQMQYQMQLLMLQQQQQQQHLMSSFLPTTGTVATVGSGLTTDASLAAGVPSTQSILSPSPAPVVDNGPAASPFPTPPRLAQAAPAPFRMNPTSSLNISPQLQRNMAWADYATDTLPSTPLHFFTDSRRPMFFVVVVVLLVRVCVCFQFPPQSWFIVSWHLIVLLM